MALARHTFYKGSEGKELMIKLNLGGGTNPIPGYEVVDRITGKEAYPLAYADNSADEIRASHILEHFSHRWTLRVIEDWVRVLRPGGLLKIAVPDFEWIVEKYHSDEAGSLPLEAYLMGSQIAEDDGSHLAIFNEAKLQTLMEMAGLVQITRWTGDEADCSGLPVSLNLQGYKPEGGANV